MSVILGAGDGMAPGDAGAAPVKDVTTAGFQRDVLQESMTQPVIADFWAPWCEPCKQLAPVLEKAVRQAQGKVKLVKINIEEEPQIAQALRVQSIPAVFAFDRGQPVDGFVGAQPESQIRAFVERLVGAIGPSPLEQALEQATKALEAKAFEQAAAIFRQILGHEADNIDALAGLARAEIALGRASEARRLVDELPEEAADDDRIRSVRAQLDLLSAGDGDTAALEARVGADGRDLQARFELAQAYAALDRRDDAIDQLIEIVRREKSWNDDAARKELIKFFEAFGPTDAATIEGRRKLSSAWFA